MQHSISKQILRIITIIVIVLLSILLLLYIFVRTPIGSNILKKFIESALTETFQDQVEIGTLKTDIFSWVKLEDITIHNETAESSTFEIGLLEIHYNLFSILKNKISISSILVDSLKAKILRDENGNFLLPTPGQKGEQVKNPLQVSFKSIRLRNSIIMYEDSSIPLHGNIQDLELQLKHSTLDSSYNFSTTLSSAVVDYENQQYSVENILIIGSTRGQNIKVDTLSLESEGISICGNANIFIKGDPDIDGEIEINGNPGQLIAKLGASLPPQLRPLHTDFVAFVTFDGSVSEPNLHAELTYHTLEIGELALQNGKFDMVVKNDSLSIQKIYCEIFDGSISAQGWMMLDSTESYHVDLNISNIDYTQLWEYLYGNDSPYKGFLTGTVSSSGTITSILSSQFSGEMQLHKIMYEEKSINPIDCIFSYKTGDAALHVVQDSSYIESEFVLHDSKIDGSASVHINNIEYIAGLFNLLGTKGKLYADANFSGKLSSPEIHVKVKGSGLSYMNFPADSLFAEIQYADNSLFIKSSSFTGRITSLALLTTTLLDEEVLGRVQYQGSLTGNLENLSGNFSLHADSVKYQNFSVPSLVLECTAENSDISIKTLHIDTEKIRCEAQGNFSLSDRTGNVYVNFKKNEKNTKDHLGSIESSFSIAQDISLKADLKVLSLDMLAAFSDSLAGIQGSVSGNVSFEGMTRKPTGTIFLTIDKPAYKDFFIDKISIQGNLTPSEIILSNGTVQLFKNEIRIRGKIGLDESKGGGAVNPHSALRGEISLSDVKLANFTQEFLDAVQVMGTLTSTVQISGSVASPVINGSFGIENGFLQLDKHKSPIENLEALLVFSDSTMNINKFTGLYEGKPFSLTGSISESDWSSFSPDIALSINGTQAVIVKGIFQQEDMDIHISLNDFDIAFLETITPAIMNAQGSVNASVNTLGTMSNPKFRGWIKADNFGIHPADVPVPFSDCTLDISATDERIALQEFQCKFGKGSIKSSGHVDYDDGDIKDIALHFEAEGIVLNEQKKYKLNIPSCTLDYSRQKNGYLIDGIIVMGETKYLEDIQISKILDSMTKPRLFRKPSQLMMQTKLNIRITDSKDIWIDNNIARIQMRSDISVIGTLAQPNLTGRLEISEGYIIYLDRKFTITRGILDFADPNVINPILDIQAETDIKNYSQPDAEPYHIIFAMTGPADKAAISLQSIPALDEANILSLLTFGTTREQIFSQTPDKYNTSLKDILLERAEQYSSQKISGFVAGQMAHIFDLDDVTIEGNLFDFGDSWGPQLVASKQLLKRMKVTYSTRIGYLNEQSIELDYKLTDNFYLQGQADQEGNTGIDLLYRVNFK